MADNVASGIPIIRDLRRDFRPDSSPIQTCIVEEARWYKDDEDEDDYERVIVKTYRPNVIASSLELQELLEECKRVSSLKHP